MKFNKKFAVTAISLALIASAAAAGTLAYFTDAGTAHNIITSGTVDIEVVEKTLGDDGEELPYPTDAITGIMPGTTVSKIVRVKNTGTAPAHVRVKVSTVVTLADSTVDAEGAQYVSYEVNTADWTEKEDGYYYYNTSLAAGDTTEPLFEEVAFDVTMGNKYQNSTAEIDVQAFATQTANNGATPLEAAADSWPAESAE